ncbi:hypothetical protein NL533_33105, partial [Klebsiella pneumoniae]|nr:hypothetical protein [Klebsiella pneumoniae]
METEEELESVSYYTYISGSFRDYLTKYLKRTCELEEPHLRLLDSFNPRLYGSAADVQVILVSPSSTSVFNISPIAVTPDDE